MQDLNRTTPIGAVAYFRNCIKDGDVNGALSCFHPEAVYIDRDGRELRGLDQIEKAMQAICALQFHISGATPHISIVGDLAMWMDLWEMNGTTPDGHPIQMTGHTACIMKKDQAGNWLWIVDNPFGSAVLQASGL